MREWSIFNDKILLIQINNVYDIQLSKIWQNENIFFRGTKLKQDMCFYQVNINKKRMSIKAHEKRISEIFASSVAANHDITFYLISIKDFRGYFVCFHRFVPEEDLFVLNAHWWKDIRNISWPVKKPCFDKIDTENFKLKKQNVATDLNT